MIAARSAPRSEPANSHDLRPHGKAALRPVRRIVRQADPAVIDEAGEPIPAAQHIVDRLGDRGCVRRDPGGWYFPKGPYHDHDLASTRSRKPIIFPSNELLAVISFELTDSKMSSCDLLEMLQKCIIHGSATQRANNRKSLCRSLLRYNDAKAGRY